MTLDGTRPHHAQSVAARHCIANCGFLDSNAIQDRFLERDRTAPRMTTEDLAALLRWYVDAGVDETIGEIPIDRTRALVEDRPAIRPSTAATAPASAGSAVSAPAGVRSAEAVVEDAVSVARDASSVESLAAALAAFDGCALKKTATNLVFGRGSPEAEVVLIGEAPGAEEDRQGLPFVGPSGKLLDRMLDSIGLGEDRVFISNTVFWRPPGNRDPTTNERAACLPFLERLIELVHPKVLVALGGPASNTLIGRTESVGKLRGRWFDYQSRGLGRPVATTVTYHPAYLLRSPMQKRLAWRDMLGIRRRLDEL